MRTFGIHRVCVLALLPATFLLGAVTEVSLSPSATPAAGDPGVTNITVIGHNFPSGTILPGSVTVTLNPTTAGAGPSGTTAATAVSVVSGATERVTFVTPTSINVSVATSYQVSIAGTSSTGNAFASSNTAALTVNAPVAITTNPMLPAGTVAANYSLTVTAKGGSGTYSWAVSAGALPGGLSLNAATGVISGQPSAAGTTTFKITATDSLHASATRGFSLTVNPQLEITTSSPLPVGTVGASYSQTLAATGGSGTYTWSGSQGALPDGLLLNAATGGISGQPTIAGTLKFGIQVTDSNQATAAKSFSVTINPQLEITTSSPLPAATVGVSYSQTLKAIGGSGQYTWSVSQGALPAGLSLNPATGVISGQPSTPGAPKFGIQVTDSNQVSVAKAFALTVSPGALLITTTSPLPAASPAVPYSQTFAATGGSGGYTWSATGLPAWLALSPAGALTGTPPLTAVDSAFTVKVSDSSSNIASGTFTIPLTLAITSTSPLPDAQVGVNYSQTLMAIGGTGAYTWSLTTGSLPAGLTLTSATGLISGQPTTAASLSFTAQVQDSNLVAASQPFTLTVDPPASLKTVSPTSSYAGLTLQVNVTGANTHFVQGATVVTFGEGISVGGAADGKGGPVDVTSPTTAIATIVISSTAVTSPRTVTAATGSEQVSLVNSFTVEAAIPYITINTGASAPLPQGFSGFDDGYLVTGVEYWDPKYLAMVEPLKPGWIRFPSGTPDMAFDWQTGFLSQPWIQELAPNVLPAIHLGLVRAEQLTQAKCGSQLSNYGTFIQTLGANGVVVVNGFTDTHPDSAGKLVTAAQAAGLNILDWEIDNEPYGYPDVFPTSTEYLSSAHSPYYQNIVAADPNATAGVFLMGQFSGLTDPPYNYQAWDTGVSTYPSPFWKSVSYHVYPISDQTIATTDEEQTLNGFLAHGTTEYFSSYIQPLIGTSMPVYITELNSDGYGTLPFESYIYNAVYLAEFIARMSTVPQVKLIGMTDLYLGNAFNQGAIRAVDDYETYLINYVESNPTGCIDTATNPNTQFSFYYSTSGLAMEIVNLAVNNSNATWPTTVTGGPTVPIQGYDGNPVPAIFAQGYQGSDGTHFVLITNKSGSSVPVAVEPNGILLGQTVTVSYISNASDTAQNTAASQQTVQIVTATSANPITVGPYSVTRVEW